MNAQRFALLATVLGVVVPPARAEPAPTEAAAAARATDVEGIVLDPGGLTADESARRALAGSAGLEEKRAALDAAEARIRQTTLEFVPKVGLRGSYTRLSHVAFPASFGNLDLPENQWGMTARLDVPLSDYVLRLSDAADSADASRRAARLARDAEMRRVELDARILYYNYVRAHAQCAVAAGALERVRLRLADAEAGVAVGRLAAADLMRIQALVANAELGVQETESLRALIGAQLAIVMDDAKGGTYTIGEGVPEVGSPAAGTPADVRALISTALQRRLEIKAIDALYSAYRFGEGAARASGWPRLDGFADYTYANPNARYFPPESEFDGSWAAGVALSFTLDAPFASDARGDELAAEAAAARARRRAVEGAIANEVVSAQLDVGRAHAALRASETSVRAAEESYRVTADLFRVGRATPSDLIDAESELRTAKLSSVDARIDIVIAALRLRHAVGE